MPKATATIAHIHWREKDNWETPHPRFAPGPRLQRLGYKSQDLKHPDGAWFTHAECVKFSRAISAEADARQAAQQQGASLPRLARAHSGRTLGQLCEAVFDLPEFLGQPLQDGKRQRAPLADKTVSGYRYCRRAVEAACARLQLKLGGKETLWHAPAQSLQTKHLKALLDEVEIESGLSAARAVRAFLRQMWSRLGRKEPGVNRNLFDDLERMPVPDGRLRPWEPEEFWHMVQVADAMGLPGMADNFFWGALTGLRQTDRLTMRRAAITETHITVMPSKTKHKTAVTVQVKYAGLLKERQDAAWKRRAEWPVESTHVLADEKNRKPWEPEASHFRHIFAQVRDRAAETMPSCASLTDQDLRDTQQTWLDRHNVDPELMSLAAGHALRRQLTQLQRKHYVAANQQRLDAAFDLLNTYLLTYRPQEKRSDWQ